MGGLERGKLGSGDEMPGSICKSVPADVLFWTYDVYSAVVEVCPLHNPQCWEPLCATEDGIKGKFFPVFGRGQERGGC